MNNQTLINIARIAALRAFAMGVGWARLHPSPLESFSEADLTACEDRVVNGLYADGIVGRPELEGVN